MKIITIISSILIIILVVPGIFFSELCKKDSIYWLVLFSSIFYLIIAISILLLI